MRRGPPKNGKRFIVVKLLCGSTLKIEFKIETNRSKYMQNKEKFNKNEIEVVSNMNNGKEITICLESSLQIWDKPASSEFNRLTSEYPTQEGILEVMSEIIYGSYYEEGIKDLRSKLEIEILYKDSDKGELVELEYNVTTGFNGETVKCKEQYRGKAVYYVRLSSEDKGLIEIIRSQIDYTKVMLEKGISLSEKDKEKLDKYYFEAKLGRFGELGYVHYIPKDCNLKEHLRKMKSKYENFEVENFIC